MLSLAFFIKLYLCILLVITVLSVAGLWLIICMNANSASVFLDDTDPVFCVVHPFQFWYSLCFTATRICLCSHLV